MSERSILRLRERVHYHPQRRKETIVEIVRDGAVVATIYGSREGIHVVSERFGGERNEPFFLRFGEGAQNVPSVVVPLLAAGEPCPWCSNGVPIVEPCPVCGAKA